MDLRCDMATDCQAPVTHIDDKGYAYCTEHGRERQAWRRCRKLRPAELRKLQRGEQLAHY
jgi:hypothetical protein